MHFGKHSSVSNCIYHSAMFLVFKFLHFPCKLRLLLNLGEVTHNVFSIVTNLEWIPARSIHNGNKNPTDLATYFQNGNHFHLIWITIQINYKLYPSKMETVPILETCIQIKWKRFPFCKLFPNQMENFASILDTS